MCGIVISAIWEFVYSDDFLLLARLPHYGNNGMIKALKIDHPEAEYYLFLHRGGKRYEELLREINLIQTSELGHRWYMTLARKRDK